MRDINTTYELFMHDLKSIYYLEDRLETELGHLAAETTNEDLSEVLRENQEETEEQVNRLENVFTLLGEDIEGHAASDFEGHFEELDNMNKRITEAEMFDISVLNSAIKTEQMEITTYKGLLCMADQMVINDSVERNLQDNLEEEGEALDKLRRLTGESWLKQATSSFIS